MKKCILKANPEGQRWESRLFVDSNLGVEISSEERLIEKEEGGFEVAVRGRG